ncbi:hypothetical protein ABJ851_004228 [Shigella flexneri]|nr:hypothetical protein [Escherichia coli]
MNKDEALNFLELHQPMPADCDITQELIDRYDEVRIYFMTYPDKEAIPLFLRSFGDGDGLGIYPVVEDFLYKCDFNDVIKNIVEILENPNIIKSVRLWCTILTMSFPDKNMINGLKISAQTNDEDIHDMALLSLKLIKEKFPN